MALGHLAKAKRTTRIYNYLDLIVVYNVVFDFCGGSLRGVLLVFPRASEKSKAFQMCRRRYLEINHRCLLRYSLRHQTLRFA